MSWDRTEQTLKDAEQGLSSAETPQQFQSIGQLARDTLISLAQAVFRADAHWQSSEPLPSPTDSKRLLEAYISVALAGGGREEARAFARSAIKLADALTHDRSATLKDARLAVAATDAVVRVVALIDGYELQDDAPHGTVSKS